MLKLKLTYDSMYETNIRDYEPPVDYVYYSEADVKMMHELSVSHPELFNNVRNNTLNSNTIIVRTVTFQVTDDCCMACTYCY